MQTKLLYLTLGMDLSQMWVKKSGGNTEDENFYVACVSKMLKVSLFLIYFFCVITIFILYCFNCR